MVQGISDQKRAELAIRDAGILQRKADGEDNADIAAALSLHPSTVARAIARAIREAGAASAATLRDREYERRLYYLEELEAIIHKKHVHVHNGMPTDVVDDRPRIDALREARLMSESMAKLLGLDMPVKIDTTVSVRFEVAVNPELYR